MASFWKKQLTDDEKKELIKQLEALKERLREQAETGNRAQRLRDFQRRARGQERKPGEEGGESGKPGQPGQAQVELVPTGPGVPIPTAVPTQASEAQDGASPSAGKDAGHTHDENLSGDPSRLQTKSYDDKAAAGQDSGQGPSESETIASAAERGFVSGAYEKLYHEYETVAEEVMDKDHIPPGRRSHVRRYFDLIRPREAK